MIYQLDATATPSKQPVTHRKKQTGMASAQDRGPPSAAAIAIGTAIISGITGYFIGQGRSIGLFGGSSNAHARIGKQYQDNDSDLSDVDSESGAAAHGELETFLKSDEECKLVLVVRTDLGMTKGK